MDGILNVLLVLGFIGIGIFRLVMKQANDSEQKSSRAPFGMEEVFPEIAPLPPSVSPPPKSPKVNRNKTVEHPKRTVDKIKPREVIQSPLQEDEFVSHDIDIRSMDEVRKGIIWSEILNRKF